MSHVRERFVREKDPFSGHGGIAAPRWILRVKAFGTLMKLWHLDRQRKYRIHLRVTHNRCAHPEMKQVGLAGFARSKLAAMRLTPSKPTTGGQSHERDERRSITLWKLVNRRPVVERDEAAWAVWYQTHEKGRTVAESYVETQCEPVRIVTVFLGINLQEYVPGQPPVFFVTLVTGGVFDDLYVEWARGEYGVG